MVRWAMIGAGRVNSQMASGIHRANNAQLVGVFSRTPEATAQFALDHEISTIYPTLDDLLADDGVDVVYVASPNSTHRDHVIAVAAAGKHVLCEKPMSNMVADCLEMIAACDNAHVVLGIAFQYRQHPAHRAIRELVTGGDLGIAVFADAAVHVPPLVVPKWYFDQSVAVGGVVPMAGVHRIDLLRFVLNSEISVVQSVMRRRNPDRPFEDTVAAILEFESGAIATVRFALDVMSAGDGVTVQGTTGWASAIRTTSQWWASDGGELASSLDGETNSTVFPKQDLYRFQVEEFSGAVKGDNEFSATGQDGLRSVEAADALFTAAQGALAVRTNCISTEDMS